MADDNVKSTVIRKARVSFVKDNIQNIIHYETDADCVKNLNTAIINGVSNVFNNDETIRDIITNIALKGEDLTTYAKLDSPSFTGEPKAPTPATSDSSLKIANTEFVNNKIAELKNTTANKTELNNYVTKTGNDTITGLKTFNTDINTSDTSTIYWKTGNNTVASINKTNYTGTSDKAVKDQNGNIINSTYATKTELNNKQNTLTFDTTPKSGSTNPVTSDGIYKAIKASGAISGDSLAVVAKTGSYTDLINTPSLATDSTLGFTKLYSSSGSRIDGTITQAGITELLSYKLDRENLADIALSGEWSDIYNVPIANDSTQGITKLYSTSGTNTDGAISQYGINNILANYAKLTDITAAYRYKGTVDNYSDLPTAHKTGDVYNIKNADAANKIKAGDNVVWNGTEWDNLSGVVDLSAYLTTEKANELYLGKNDNAVSATTVNGHTVNSDVPANAKFTDTIYTLPVASSSVLGGVKIGDGLTITDGVLSANVQSVDLSNYPTLDGNNRFTSENLFIKPITVQEDGTSYTRISYGAVIIKDSFHDNTIGLNSSGLFFTDTADYKYRYFIEINKDTETFGIKKYDARNAMLFDKTIITDDNLAKVATTGSYNDLKDLPTIPEGAVIDATLSSTSTNALQNKVVKAELDKKANIESPTFTGTTTTNNLTVNGSLNIPGGKIWIE